MSIPVSTRFAALGDSSLSFFALKGAIAAFAVVLSACGSGGDGGEGDPPPPAQEAPVVGPVLAQYGTHPLQEVMLLPAKARLGSPAAAPRLPQDSKGLVVWVHGGGWYKGDLREDLFALEPLTEAGYSVLAVNYRLGPEGVWPKANEDVLAVARAVERGGCEQCSEPTLWRYVQALAQQKGWQIAGGSAGGYLAVDVAMRHLDEGPSLLKCVNNVVGPLDFADASYLRPPLYELVLDYADGDLSQGKLLQMSPARRAEFISPQGQQRLSELRWDFGYSREDAFVPFALTMRMANALLSWGASNVVTRVLERPYDGAHAISLEDYESLIREPVVACFE